MIRMLTVRMYLISAPNTENYFSHQDITQTQAFISTFQVFSREDVASIGIFFSILFLPFGSTSFDVKTGRKADEKEEEKRNKT